jgi:hypothetical protein
MSVMIEIEIIEQTKVIIMPLVMSRIAIFDSPRSSDTNAPSPAFASTNPIKRMVPPSMSLSPLVDVTIMDFERLLNQQGQLAQS